MNSNNNGSAAGGIGFCGLLTIAFIILKLTGVISWSWLWVLAPIWIPTAIVLAVLLVVLIVVLVKEGVKQTEERQRRELRSENIDEQARRYGLERQPGESDLELKKRISYAESNLHEWLNRVHDPQKVWSRTAVTGTQPREGGAPDE